MIPAKYVTSFTNAYSRGMSSRLPHRSLHVHQMRKSCRYLRNLVHSVYILISSGTELHSHRKNYGNSKSSVTKSFLITRSFPRIRMIITIIIECLLSLFASLLVVNPVGTLFINSCNVLSFRDWYTLFANPADGYCSSEAVYPL
jgi:hypothetical protein